MTRWALDSDDCWLPFWLQRSEARAQGFNPYSGIRRPTSKQPKASDGICSEPEAKAKSLAPAGDSRATDTTPVTDAYRIGPQDVLEISVFGVPDLSGSLIVAR